jgi:tetratricopeptide (TPR) repeat protein
VVAYLFGDLCIEGWPEERLLVPLAELQGLLGELDRALDCAPDDASTRLLRAGLRLDAGDRDGARADLAALERSAPSPYLREVVARFAALPPGARGIEQLDLAGLPPPVTPTDCFVAGFHALRGRDSERADELLGRAAEWLPARDLRLLAVLGLKKPDPDRIIAEASWLEGRYGRPTARTRHALGAAMLMQRRYAAAIPYIESALALRPDRHGPWINLGLAHLRCGHLDEARRCCERAVALRPQFPNSLSGLCQVLREQGDYAAADAVAQRIADRGWSCYDRANVELVQAVAAWVAGDAARRRAHAVAAVEGFRAAAAAGPTRNPRAAGVPASLALVEALGGDEPGAALGLFVQRLRSDPANARQLINLAGLLVAQPPDPAAGEQLTLLLSDLAVELAPEDAALRDQRDHIRAAVQKNRSR